MSGHIENIAGGMMAGTDHVVDAIVSGLPAALEPLPITCRIRMGGNSCLRCFDFSVGLTTCMAQRMSHRRLCIFLDFRRMAKLAATCARRFAEPLWLGCSAGVRRLLRLSPLRNQQKREHGPNNE